MAKKLIIVDSAVMSSLSDSPEDIAYFHKKSAEIAKTIGLKDFSTFIALIRRSPPKITVAGPKENGFSDGIGWMCMEPYGYSVKLYFVHNVPEFDIPYSEYAVRGSALEANIRRIHQSGFTFDDPKLLYSMMLWKDLVPTAKKRMMDSIIEKFLLRT
jgi:hypothetical protein